jgi:hypothetical protein
VTASSQLLQDAARKTLTGKEGRTEDSLEEAEYESYREDGGDVEREGQPDKQLCRGFRSVDYWLTNKRLNSRYSR